MTLRATIKAITPKSLLELRDFIHRRRQSRRPNRDIFSEIYRANAWGDENSPKDFFSGYGSYDRDTVNAYIAAIEPMLRQIPNVRVTDLGCGDFNVGSQIRHLCGPYIACDVVPELIERNKVKFTDADVDFCCLDITSDALPPGDIALVRQVLQHLSNEQIVRFLKQLNGYKILILTDHIPLGEFEPNIDKATGAGVRLHGLKPSGIVLSAPPFNLNCKSQVLCDAVDGASFIRTTAYYL